MMHFPARHSVLPAILAALAVSRTSLHAQHLCTPAGMNSIEGNHALTLFEPGSAGRFQQIDDTLRGTPAVLRSMSLRRDGAGGGNGADARSLTIEVAIGTTDLALCTSSFDALLGRSPQLAIASRTIALPDLRSSAGTPAAFDVMLPFDRPVTFDGLSSLTLDVRWSQVVTPAGSHGIRLDAVDSPYWSMIGTTIGHGCIASGQSMPFLAKMSLENHGTGMPDHAMRMRAAASHAPPTTPVALNLAFTDVGLRIPSLCTKLHVMPLHSFAIGVSDSAGNVPELVIACPFMPQLFGYDVKIQMLAIDAGAGSIPVVLSNASAGRFRPMMSGPAPDVAFHRGPPNVAHAGLVFGHGLVIELGL
ncbi:MAG: hypothetical protein AB7I19_15220 [Planctomycetota bacterium]